MSNKDRYRAYCEHARHIPLYANDWWLDAAAGRDNWDVAIVERNSQIAATMPYTMKRKRSGIHIGQPISTQSLGPCFAPNDQAPAKRASSELQLMDELIDQLPVFAHFSQGWHYSCTNWLPFYWRGFSQTTRYTYLIPLDRESDPTAKFFPNMRNKVRKAKRLTQVDDSLELRAFYEILEKTFTRQRMATPFSYDFVQKADCALDQRGRRKIFGAVDSDANVHSALYLTWDNQSAYVHMVGEDPRFRQSGAGIFLIAHALEFSRSIGLKVFDFVGSMLRSVEIVRRSCGGVQVPYFWVSKTTSRLLRTRELLSLIRRGT